MTETTTTYIEEQIFATGYTHGAIKEGLVDRLADVIQAYAKIHQRDLSKLLVELYERERSFCFDQNFSDDVELELNWLFELLTKKLIG